MKTINALVFAAVIAAALLMPFPAVSEEGATAESQNLEKAISWQEAMGKEGETVVVEARIVSVYDPESRGRGGPVRLNTDRDFKTSLTIVFYKKDREGKDQGFGDPSRFEGKTVRVRGKVSDYKGQKQLSLSGPDQIEIVENAPPPPPPSAAEETSAGEAPDTAISWQEAMGREGQTVTVEARIVSVYDPESRGRKGPVKLNTDRDYRSSLTIVFYKKDREGNDQGFGDPSRFEGKTVRVRGKVSSHQDQLQLSLTGPDRIEIVENAPPPPPPPAAEAITGRTRIPGTAVSWQDAMKMVGQEVTVEARIFNVYDPDEHRPGPFLQPDHHLLQERPVGCRPGVRGPLPLRREAGPRPGKGLHARGADPAHRPPARPDRDH